MFSPLDEKIAAYIIERGWLSSARVQIIMHDLVEKKKQDDDLNIMDLIDRRKLLSASQLNALESIHRKFQTSELNKLRILEQAEKENLDESDKLGALTKSQAQIVENANTIKDPFIGSVFGN